MQVSRGKVYLRGRTWTIGYTVVGKRVREAIGTNRQMAEAVLKKRIVQALEDRHFDKRNVGRVPFSEFAETYIARCTSLLKSAKSEANRVMYWVRVLGNRPIGQITRAELQEWQAQKRQNCKPATVNRELGRLRHMLNRAVDWELLDQSPLKGLKFLSEAGNARLRYLSLDECERLILACKAPHLRAIVTIALHTGMRSGEIWNLQWGDVDFDAGFLIVRDSKNGQSRHVPMDSTIVTLLRNWPRTAASLIFTNSNGSRLGWLQHGFRKALGRSGLTDLHFHDLRHTFASQWMMAGGDLYVLEVNPRPQINRDDSALRTSRAGVQALHVGTDGEDLDKAHSSARPQISHRESSQAHPAASAPHKGRRR